MDYIYDPKNKRRDLMNLKAQLLYERTSFEAHWREISDFMLPTRSRFYTSDVNRGGRKNQKIIDSTASLALRTLSSGMMAGITSPARQWFRLQTSDPALNEYGSVKNWLEVVSNDMRNMFVKSNLYNALPITYKDLGAFSTAAMLVEEDFEDLIRCYSFPIGSYAIANNFKNKVNVFVREFEMTVRQIVEKFGYDKEFKKINWDNISQSVRDMWDRGDYEAWIKVTHIIQPNREYDPRKLAAKYKRFSSIYYEDGTRENNNGTYLTDMDTNKYLRESGYDYFPVLAPRWETTAEDVYGTNGPGMSALGDVRALQTMQKRKGQAVEKIINPPMVGPTSLKTVKSSILPGDITYVDERDGIKGFRPAHEINFRVNEITADIQDTRQIIRRNFYEDLFLMMSQSDRRDITAREIDVRQEEKLLALGPVLEQLNQDMLDPLIDIAFNMMERQGRLPPIPEELSGVELKVEYLSVMAQAQKTPGVGSLERFAGFVAQAAQMDPKILDKIDSDQMVDVYGDYMSIPPGIIRDDEAVAEIRDARAKQQQQMAQAEMMRNAAGAARDLGQTPTEGSNALTELMGQSNAGALV